jgi:hypothetical protein
LTDPAVNEVTPDKPHSLQEFRCLLGSPAFGARKVAIENVARVRKVRV